MKRIDIPGLAKPRSFEEKFPREGEFFGSREKKQKRLDPKWKQILLGMLGGIALMGAVLLISGLWKVTEVIVPDGQFYSASVIREYAELEPGDKMLGFDRSAVVDRLRKGLPLLDDIKVRKHLNGRVTIRFREITEVYYTCHNQNYYLIDASEREVLGVFSSPTEAKRVGAVYVGLPEAARVRVGEPLSFINLPYEQDSVVEDQVDYELETDEPEIEYAYVEKFIEALTSSPLAARVTGMETGDRYDIWFVLDRRIKVRVGSMDELDRKLDLVERSLEDRVEAGKDDGALPMLVDVSDPARIIHRASPDVVLPDWAIEAVP